MSTFYLLGKKEKDLSQYDDSYELNSHYVFNSVFKLLYLLRP